VSKQVSVMLRDKDGIETGEMVDYTLRSLNESDVATWAAFCAACFSYKPNPPPAQYFERHFWRDPRRDASLIWVFHHETEGIVSSLRIFRRRISMGPGDNSSSNSSDAVGHEVEAGGIGEVCTTIDHRGRGLAGRLLKTAMDTMMDLKLGYSLLHAAPAFIPVYKKSSYSPVVSKWSVLFVPVRNLRPMTDNEMTIRSAQYPRDTDQLQAIHKEYSELRLAGCVIRSKEYWNEYLSEELGDSLLVLCRANVVLAWIATRPRGRNYQVRDFGCKVDLISARSALSSLLYATLEKEGFFVDSAMAADTEVNLQLPTIILNDIIQAEQSPLEFWTSVIAEDDGGWMYKPIVPANKDGQLISCMTERTNMHGIPHLVWPADSF
jgi:hypothetical protein